MGAAGRYAGFVTTYSRVVVLVMLVATLVMGVGAGNVEGGLSITSFESDTTEAQKLEYVEANFSTEGENTTVLQIVVRAGEGENTLSKASLLETLRLQRAIREDPKLNATLRAQQPTLGLANLIAIRAIQQDRASGPPPGQTNGSQAGDQSPARPSIDTQIEHLESLSPSEVAAVVETVLASDSDGQGSVDPYSLLSTEYTPGSTTADGRILFVYQSTAGATGEDPPQAVLDAQLDMQALLGEYIETGEAFAFGVGIVDEEAGTATGESFAFITPVALLLIIVLLGVAYRDPIDVALGMLGIFLVLIWMGGAMGWLGIGVTQLIIAVPFLLIGLSIDYALHVIMRFREAGVDAPDRTPREAMRTGLAGVVVAIGAATFSTAVGFGSNLVSPIRSIQQFATVSALGILSAFLVFGLLLPALKLEVDGPLRRIGLSRTRRPFGRAGVLGDSLEVGARLAKRTPFLIIAIAVVLSAGGAAAATDIDTSIDQVDFLPRETPDWMQSLPDPFAPSEYQIRANAIYINEKFVQARAQSRAVFLVEGDVTAPATLDRIAAGQRALRNTTTAVTLADESLRVAGPLSMLRAVAQENETVAARLAESDTDGDGVPDQNLSALYDAAFAADPAAASAVIHRTPMSGEAGDYRYRALRVSVGLVGSADTGTVTSEMRTVATTMEAESDLRVTATGQPIVQELLQRGLLTTLVEGFLLTFGVIVAFLTLIFWRRYETLSLGLVVILPVVFALAWLFGTMYLADISFNTETAIIASIAIGIGVDYAIHIGERFMEEIQDLGATLPALDRTMRGTGGALFASAISTAGGFAVLMLALVPSLQRFGFVTATAIVYAFIASVLVLPSLLALWTRYTGRAAT